jgi:hypothetical protein
MATVTITYRWGNGDAAVFEVQVDPRGYPDALDQARATVMRMYRDVVGVAEDAGDGGS